MPFKPFAVVVLLWFAAAHDAQAALADDLNEVTRLLHAGQAQQALERADRTLAATPKDAQMRFLKSVVLTDLGRQAEAMAMLTQLAQDYPELAEPHNNLAALYAAAGDYGRARSELEEAIRLNPGYAPAHENLGDVLVMLAGQSYSRALKLEPASAGIARKLALVRQVAAPASGVAAALP